MHLSHLKRFFSKWVSTLNSLKSNDTISFLNVCLERMNEELTRITSELISLKLRLAENNISY